MTAQTDKAPEIDLIEDEGPAPDSSTGGIGFASLVCVAAIVFLIQATNIQTQAGLWPSMLAGTLIVLAGAQTIFAILQRMRHNSAALEQQGSEPFSLRRIFTAGWLFAYCLVAQWVGFGPAMLVFVPVYMFVMGYRKPLWIVAVTAGFAVGLTLMFDTVANVPVWSSRL
ncbi:tripartite tricarboxylate transporter TctB family protein [Aquamicrobium zhengzhouense]|uniref:Tripartite tricarboxylate transporter TctB family protein n=1 Tax=Aquamicrobium zhengzhouense TaxID=2781738 RepID=A0ABS0SIN6_9HYPH|nr:tripartite tricarboxylate transporter TctB family protein [Aquamicrobium zhengzhouense]MBI1622403.1 tripartite tricarboxylate transporter TctB family protein [Aquamicrobium zhengzhouense]